MDGVSPARATPIARSDALTQPSSARARRAPDRDHAPLPARRGAPRLCSGASPHGISAPAIFRTRYRDLDALAVAILTEAFAEIESLDLRLRPTESATSTARETTSALVAEFARRRSLYAGVLGSRTTTDAHRAVHDAFAQQAVGTMLATAPAHVDPRTAADYVAGGSLAVITHWLLEPEPSPTEHVQQQLLALLPPG